MSKTAKPGRPPRNTTHNFVRLLSGGNFGEIAKVLRRRAINGLRFLLSPARVLLRSYLGMGWVQHRQLKRLLRRYYDWDGHSAYSEGRINLALIVREGTTYPKSSAFIRLVSPLTDPSLRQAVACRLFAHNTTDVGDADVCVVQRTAFDDLAAARRLVQNLKAGNTKLVVDTDDAFHAIDPTHPEHQSQSRRLAAFNYLVDNVDQLWLSTDRLKDEFKEAKAKKIIMPNSLDHRLWGGDAQRPASGPLRLVYMGTGTHDADFALIRPQLQRLAKDYPGRFTLTLIGVTDAVPEEPWLNKLYARHNGSIYPRFVPWFLKQGPFDVGLSPLVDNGFNRGKSDIKCLDYLAAGITPVVSDLEPYKASDLSEFITLVSDKPQAWYKSLELLLQDLEGFRQNQGQAVAKAQKYIWRARSSATVAKTMSDALARLVSKNT